MRLLFATALAFCLLAGALPASIANRLAHTPPHALAAGEGWRPNDPLYGKQGYLAALGIEDAWTTQRGAPSVLVAVVDSGVDIAQPDLQGAIWQDDGSRPLPPDCGDHGCNALDLAHVDPACDNISDQPGDVRPTYPHGTFIAGIIAARANNGIGIAGVAPLTTILPIRAGDCHGVYIPSEARGIEDAVAVGANIIDLSIGQDDCAAPPDELVRAIADAENAGVLVVAAAGNAGYNCLSAPANIANVVAVTATRADGQSKASFSDWNDASLPQAPSLILAAPGVGIEGTLPVGDGTTPLYGSNDGTSFAAPIVAGVAALLLAQNPWLSPAQLRQILAESAQPLSDAGLPGWSGSGLVRADRALADVPLGLSGKVTLAGQPTADGTAITATINGIACGAATSYSSGDGEGYLLFVPPATVQPGCGTPGATVTISVAGQPVARVAWSPGPLSLPLNAPG